MDDAARVQALTDELLEGHDPKDRIAFRGAQYDLGLGWVHFPVGYGGLGVDPKLQRVVEETLRDASVRYAEIGWSGFGLYLAAPTIVAHAEEDTKRRLLRPLFTGEEIWCQLFSEPGAGSDLASLSTRAVRDGDEWVVNGQKVWNTLAHIADRGMLVARTDPDVPKHRGLTYFALDMHASGVEVRPLVQITGEAEFNEVYMTDARVADRDRIGGVGDGWRVSMTTLMNERVTIGGAVAQRESGPIADLLKVWRNLPDERRDAVARDQVTQLWIEAEILRLTNQRAAQNRKAGVAGPEGSVSKLAFAEINKRIYECAVNVMGPEGALIEYEFARPKSAQLTGGGDPRKMFLRSRANSIEGGTSEILRNILGERVLGLPGEPRVDKELPWNKVPRS